MAYDHAALRFGQNTDALGANTSYRGVLYRSKLAAQWAAFFDALRIEHVYQPKTFLLGAATPFTPDFWLPGLNAWLVVRPVDPVIRGADGWKTELFAREHSSCRVWISSGAPRAGEWHIEQLGGQMSGMARPIARALLLADDALPAERVWICGANDDGDRLVFDPVDVAGCTPDVRACCPADPNRDTVMRIAYSHVERLESDVWTGMGALASRRLADLGLDQHPV
jgi:hypothetical protein